MLLLALALAAAPATTPATLKLGIAQPYGQTSATQAKAQLEPYLTKKLKTQVTVVVLPTYDELSAALATGTVDLAWITPVAYAQAVEQNGSVTALMRALRNVTSGDLSYRGVLIVKKGSPLKSVSALKGTKVAWVSKSSASGYVFPRQFLKSSGYDPATFFGGEALLGDHPSVCRAVLEGKADVGATFGSAHPDPGWHAPAPVPEVAPKQVEPEKSGGRGDGGAHPGGRDGGHAVASVPDAGPALPPVVLVADGCANAGGADAFDVVAQSGVIPSEALAARPNLRDDVKVDKVIQTFARMTDDADGKKLLKDVFAIDGWGIAVDGDYDTVNETLHPKSGKAKGK
jgi:phosphate/phosphite/phosphonate ABC transporter binding protein